MLQVGHLPILQALGYAIINSLWQFALLWLVYLLINSILKFTSHQRYLGALSLQIAGFGWFVLTAVFYYGESLNNGAIVYNSNSAINESFQDVTFKQMFFNVVLKAELLLPYLSLAYLILVTCLSFRVVKSYRQTQVLRYNGLEKIDVNWRLFVNRISSQLGIKRSVRIYISTIIQSPVTIGFLKPLILLPAAIVNNLNTEQIEAILIHELAHIKRNDYLFNILVSIIEVTLFFNPFMQLISKQMKRERENSCDDWVLQYEYNACNYAKALLKIATYRNPGKDGFAVHAVDNKRALLIRVKRMIEKKDLYSTYRQQLVSLIFITAAISSMAWFTPKEYPQNKSLVNKPGLVKMESLVAKVDNPLFNPIFFLADDEKHKMNNEIVPTVKSEIIKTPDSSTQTFAIKEIEKEIVEKFSFTKPVEAKAPLSNNIHAVNLVLDSALFQTHAAKALVFSEIKKLKKEFEMLNNSSLFQNVDWKQFWDNNKVQKQLEAAFEELKALEKQQNKMALAVNAVNKITTNCNECIPELIQLKEIAGKKITQIVKERITELKLQQSTIGKISTELNINFDIPDFSQLNVLKENGTWSYTYFEKPRIAVELKAPVKTTAEGCTNLKPGRKEKVTNRIQPEVAPQPEVTEEKIRITTPNRTLRMIRI